MQRGCEGIFFALKALEEKAGGTIMSVYIHHVALKVSDLEWNIQFFEEVFGLKIEKTAGEKPQRKVWFREGIQLNESGHDEPGNGLMDHIGIRTDEEQDVLRKSREFGCMPLQNGENWFQMPNGIKIELK